MLLLLSMESTENKINGSLGAWQLRATEDGSQTLFSVYFEETCHSIYGAREETQHVYIEGCELKRLIEEKLVKSQLKILEVGFGSGLGLEVTKDWLKERYPSYTLSYTAFELDEELARWSLLRVLGEETAISKLDLPEAAGSYLQVEQDQLIVRILLGDARKTVKGLQSLTESYHAIYQDPFSPKKNPTLWTLEWFQELIKLSSADTTMATYSASVRALKAMADAGWCVERFQGYKFKKTSTRALRAIRSNCINSDLNSQTGLLPLLDSTS